ncbi:hypothetical protein DRW07_01550 [Alteromonas sediminis]|uniref:Uncharacterized protein n=1 Tax=Alteromonas sediminis TaxID=2259342 RepID=A0A3N5Y4N6_9ALTE|nr:hypothetical protein [Alteromonas sediminis]RPJ68123.1 hypothetical protein DRW07_01550 [Alteromonas sediminis]
MRRFSITLLFFYFTAILNNSMVEARTNTESIDIEILEELTSFFSINQGVFEGAGRFLKEVENSQFVVLGELHNRQQISVFTVALLAEASKYGYQHFAVETGPYSAQKLHELSSNSLTAVTHFYDEYSNKMFGIYPIPFFGGQADLKILEEVHKRKFKLWGLDQEFVFALPFIIDDLYEQYREKISEREREIYRRLKRSLFWKNLRAQLFSSYALSCEILQSGEFLAFIEIFKVKDRSSSSIVDAISSSLNIYCLFESGSSKESNQIRINNFKQQFDKEFDRYRREQENEPKVIVKMGSYHSGRDRSPLNFHDIGHHLAEKASQMKGRTLHVRFLNRFVEGKDMYLNKQHSKYHSFIKMGTTNQWSMIDLRPLRKKIELGELVANKAETQVIKNYDIILITPNDRKVATHY